MSLRRLAVTLRVSADEFLFDDSERVQGKELMLQFQAMAKLDDCEKEVIREIVEGMLIKHDAEQWMRSKTDRATAGEI